MVKIATNQCDRCRCTAVDDTDWSQVVCYKHGTTTPIAGNKRPLDLCPKCATELTKWLTTRKRKKQPQKAAGGLARAANLTPERRLEISRKATEARWGKNSERRTPV
jgi:hypothetical protein